MTISEEILLRRDGVDPRQWPKLNCSQANELALEDSDLRVDADRKILFYDANSSSTPLQITGDGRIIGSLSCQSDLSVSGNLGVGTTTPTEKLDVAGKIKATDLEVSGTLDANTLQITGNGNLAGSLTVQSDLSVSGNLGIGTTTPTEKLDVAGKLKATNLEVSGTVQADTLQIAGNSNLGGSLTCQSNLSVSGNLGIGTTTPTEKLDVVGKIKAIDLDVNGAIATERLSVSGNVGIGTKDLKTPLHLYSRNNPAILRIQSSDAFGAGQIEFWSDPQGARNEWRPGFIKSTDRGGFTGGLAFFVNGSGFERRTSAVEVMRIENGQVGIGTTTPSERLEVNGTIKATAYEGDGSQLTGISSGKWSDGSSNSIYYNHGNVGIGTANPSKSLEVNGTVKATNFQGNGAALAYANIGSGGAIASRSPNVTSAAWNSVQKWYEIRIAGEDYYWMRYITVVTPLTQGLTVATGSVGGQLLIYFFDRSGNRVQPTHGFQFVTYKP